MTGRAIRPPGGRTAFFAVGLGLVVATLGGNAAAAGRQLLAVTLGDKARTDGLLREWPARLDSLDAVVKGSRSGGDPGATGAIGYDEKNVYVALKVRDAKFVRTAQFGDGEDHGILEIAFPSPRGFRSRVAGLYAGETGKSAGAVMMNGAKVKGARIVEAPSDAGYTLEASIPWSAFPEASTARAGLRAALRYADSDSAGSVRTVIATSGGSGKTLPPLLLEAEQGLYRNLIQGKGLSSSPARFAVGDLAGDSALEVIAIYGGYLTVLGSHYREGKEFFFEDLGVQSADITRFDVTDLTGDGKVEIVLGKRVGKKDEYREVVQILRVENGDSPFVAFQHETAIVTKDGDVHNTVSLERRAGKTALVIAQGKADGFDPATYSEPMPGDMDSALLPWQTVKSKRFTWNGKQFADEGGETWEPKVKAPSKAVPSRSDGPPAPPPPRPPSAEEMQDRLYALYRRDRNVGATKPRFDFVTDVAGDGTPERVLVHGKDIVVFGKGFKEGTSYAFITIGVESSKDVLDFTARDLTGDGKAEILVRAVLHAKASKELGGDVVDRQAFFVYRVTEGGIKRIFAAETGRSLKGDSIVGGVRFLAKGRGTLLEVSAGRAVGWTGKSYPFPVDRAPYGGLEPLMVPWGDVTTRKYRFDGSAYVAE